MLTHLCVCDCYDHNSHHCNAPRAIQFQCVRVVARPLPNSKLLADMFGSIVFVDASFGLLVFGHKVLAIVVMDGEGHSRLLSATVTPAHTEEDWLALFNDTDKLLKIRPPEKVVLLTDGEKALHTAFEKSTIPSTYSSASCAIHKEMSVAKRIGRKLARQWCKRCIPAAHPQQYKDLTSTWLEKVKDTCTARIYETCVALTKTQAPLHLWTKVFMAGQGVTGVAENIWGIRKAIPKAQDLGVYSRGRYYVSGT